MRQIRICRGMQVTALLMAIALPLLVQLAYPLYSFESLAISAALVLIGMTLGAGLSRREHLLHVVFVVLTYWLFDSLLSGPLVALLVAGALYLLLRTEACRDNVTAMLVAFCLVWTVGCVMRGASKNLVPELAVTSPNADVANKQTSLRPVIHFVLDEQMSVRTVPQSIATGHPAEQIPADFVHEGFRHYSHVWSSSSETHKSLNDLVNLKSLADMDDGGDDRFQFKIASNRYFERLISAGYSVTAVQSSFLDFCGRLKRVDCHTYSRAHQGRAMARTDAGYATRLRVALSEMHLAFAGTERPTAAVLYGAVSQGVGGLLGGLSYPDVAFSRPLLVMDVMDQIERRTASLQAGQAYFFHLIVPHTPYVLNAECRLKPHAQWVTSKHAEHSNLPDAVTYGAYWDQVACVHRRLMQIVRSIKENNAALDPIILVHGDHGARLPEVSSLKTRHEYLETYFSIYDGDSKGAELPTRHELPALFSSTLDAILMPQVRAQSSAALRPQ